METRNVTLTLQKAKEFYNSGNAALKEVALQAFTKEELTIPKYTDIKTFEDAVKALGMDNVLCDISYMEDIEKAETSAEVKGLKSGLNAYIRASAHFLGIKPYELEDRLSDIL